MLGDGIRCQWIMKRTPWTQIWELQRHVRENGGKECGAWVSVSVQGEVVFALNRNGVEVGKPFYTVL